VITYEDNFNSLVSEARPVLDEFDELRNMPAKLGVNLRSGPVDSAEYQ